MKKSLSYKLYRFSLQEKTGAELKQEFFYFFSKQEAIGFAKIYLYLSSLSDLYQIKVSLVRTKSV